MNQRVLLLAVLLGLCACAVYAGAPDAVSTRPQYTADGKLLKPANYRDWVFLTSGFGMNYSTGSNSMPMFTNVFVNPESYAEFMRTGHWPDQTIWVVELYSPVTHGSINKNGHYQDAPMGLDIEVKDSSRPKGWQYYAAGLDDTAVEPTAGSTGCLTCHSTNGAVENTFVQFYPTLLDVAVKKGTLNSGYVAPLNVTRLYDKIVNDGWEKAQATYAADKQRNPDSEFLGGSQMNDVSQRLLGNGRKNEALALSELIAREYPRSTVSYVVLADAYTQAGQKAKAISALQQALAVLPNDSSLSADERKGWEEEGRRRLAELNK